VRVTLAVLARGAGYALAFPLGYSTIGLVLSLRRPANPIGWLYAAAGLVWSLIIPLEPWVAQLVRDQRPLPLAARAAYVVLQPAWAPAIACGITLPLLLLPDGRLRSRRWRPLAAAAVAGAVLALVAGSLAPEPPEEALFPNPLALGGAAGRAAAMVAWVGVACSWSAWWLGWSRSCCGSVPPAESSVSSCAGSPLAPPPPSPPSA
jgi:hypothetical protein